jgi:hypothetical protein
MVMCQGVSGRVVGADLLCRAPHHPRADTVGHRAGQSGGHQAHRGGRISLPASVTASSRSLMADTAEQRPQRLIRLPGG